MAVVYIQKQGDTAPSITATLTFGPTPASNLTAAKEVLMHMRPKEGGEALLDIVMTIDDAATNKVSHRWEADEVDLDIIYEFEFEIIFEEEERNLSIPPQGFYELAFSEQIK